MKFCPWDGSLLVADTESSQPGFRLRCVVCPYVFRLSDLADMSRESDTNRMGEVLSFKTRLKPKVAGDILGGESAWKNVPETTAICVKCRNNKAYYVQLQTRSADEPMTVFYKCTKCKAQWKE